jgi:hypothetical protein
MEKERLIKDQNRKLLVCYLMANIIVFSLFAAFVPSTFEDINNFFSKLKSPKGFLPFFAFPLCIVLEGLIHSDTKAMLVFWRLKDPYPGSEAFSKIAPNDPRIAMTELRRLFPRGFPKTRRDQNSAWYKLYRAFSDNLRVYDAHKNFLLTRDLASLTVVLLPVCVIVHLFWETPLKFVALHALLLVGLVFIMTTSSQHYGKRFVANVLVEAIKNRKQERKSK